MAVLRNTGLCAIIVPFMDVDAGLVAPGQNASGVPIEAMECDFVRGCVERGEMEVVEDFSDEEYEAFRNPQSEVTEDEPSMDELRVEAEELGIEPDKRWSRTTLVARIAEARGE